MLKIKDKTTKQYLSYMDINFWDASFSDGGYKYANRHDFYFKCKVCGYFYFNNTSRKEELEYIKEWDKNNKD